MIFFWGRGVGYLAIYPSKLNMLVYIDTKKRNMKVKKKNEAHMFNICGRKEAE